MKIWQNKKKGNPRDRQKHKLTGTNKIEKRQNKHQTSSMCCFVKANVDSENDTLSVNWLGSMISSVGQKIVIAANIVSTFVHSYPQL